MSSEVGLTKKVLEIMNIWEDQDKHEPVEMKLWHPKNPEVNIPVTKDTSMSKKQWNDSNFPYFELPDQVTTHVNTKLWHQTLKEFKKDSRTKNYVMIIEKSI